MTDPDDPPEFERVDWGEIDRSRRLVTPERLALAVSLAAVGALALYDTYVAHVYLIAGVAVEPIDWVFLLALAVLVAYGAVPAVRHRTRVRRVLTALGSRPVVAVAGVYLVVFVAVGLVGPLVFSRPEIRFGHAFHPPIGWSSPVVPADCLGGVVGEPFQRRCQWSWTYPLGTNERGHPMGFLLVSGARVALYVVAIAAAFVVPVAAAVGVAAGVRGGLLDDLLMSYVDVQLCVPALVLYLVGYMYWNPSLLLLVAAFGLLGWGGVARMVRSEALQRREAGYVLVARSTGASDPYLAKRHVVPNSTNTLVPAVCQLLALFVLAEAGVAFLGFHDIELYSWGATIAESVNARTAAPLQSRADYPAYRIWWVSTLPALALSATLLSFKLVGDGLRDALDPRGDR